MLVKGPKLGTLNILVKGPKLGTLNLLVKGPKIGTLAFILRSQDWNPYFRIEVPSLEP